MAVFRCLKGPLVEESLALEGRIGTLGEELKGDRFRFPNN